MSKTIQSRRKRFGEMFPPFHVTAELKEQIYSIAKQRNVPAADIVREALTAYINTHRKEIKA